jgi:hypothetical protein
LLSLELERGRRQTATKETCMSIPTVAPRATSAPVSPVNAELERFMQGVVARDPDQPEFHQAVREVAESVMPLVLDDRRYRDAKILERMAEPERVITFRVAWENDLNEVQINRAWRVRREHRWIRESGGSDAGLRSDVTR